MHIYSVMRHSVIPSIKRVMEIIFLQESVYSKLRLTNNNFHNSANNIPIIVIFDHIMNKRRFHGGYANNIASHEIPIKSFNNDANNLPIIAIFDPIMNKLR